MFGALAQAAEPAAQQFCSCKGVLQLQKKVIIHYDSHQVTDSTEPWSNAESLTLKLLECVHGFSDSSMFPCCTNI